MRCVIATDGWLGYFVCKYFNWFLACLVSIYMQNNIKPLGLASINIHEHIETHQANDDGDDDDDVF